MKATSAKPNLADTREAWLRAATSELRLYFAERDLPIPENIRFAIAFPSTGRRGSRVGECWHSSTSEDGNFEIIIRADIADPVQVLASLRTNSSTPCCRSMPATASRTAMPHSRSGSKAE